MYLPYETSSKSVHCAYAVDSGNYSASVDDVANFIVQYTWPVAVAQALKDRFAKLQGDKDRISKAVL